MNCGTTLVHGNGHESSEFSLNVMKSCVSATLKCVADTAMIFAIHSDKESISMTDFDSAFCYHLDSDDGCVAAFSPFIQQSMGLRSEPITEDVLAGPHINYLYTKGTSLIMEDDDTIQAPQKIVLDQTDDTCQCSICCGIRTTPPFDYINVPMERKWAQACYKMISKEFQSSKFQEHFDASPQ